MTWSLAIFVYWSRGIPAIRWSWFAIAREFISKALRLPSTPKVLYQPCNGARILPKMDGFPFPASAPKFADCAKKMLVRAVTILSLNSLSRCCRRVKIFLDEELDKVRSQEVAESFVVQFAYDPLAMVSSHRVSFTSLAFVEAMRRSFIRTERLHQGLL